MCCLLGWWEGGFERVFQMEKGRKGGVEGELGSGDICCGAYQVTVHSIDFKKMNLIGEIASAIEWL